MGFKLDEGNTGFKPLEPGIYEVYPSVFAKEVSSNGNKMAQFNYIVRDDIDQPGQGQEIRYDNFVETPNALWRVNQASKAAGLDMEKEYESIYEWAEDFVGKAVAVEVGTREYDGKTYPEVKRFLPSRYGGELEIENNGPIEDPFKDDGQPIDISDDDLPF